MPGEIVRLPKVAARILGVRILLLGGTCSLPWMGGFSYAGRYAQ
jgi:hypothetical protein